MCVTFVSSTHKYFNMGLFDVFKNKTIISPPWVGDILMIKPTI